MKIKTEITTRNWNNAWIDIDQRLPKNDTDCYILWKARVIKYDYDTMKSENISKFKGMGNAVYKNGKWEEITTESRCEDCWNQHTNNLYGEYFLTPLEESKPVYGTSKNGNKIITVSDYTIIDLDIFESESKKANILWKYFHQEKPKAPKTRYMYSCDFEILAWCSIPDEPINPFEEDEDE